MSNVTPLPRHRRSSTRWVCIVKPVGISSITLAFFGESISSAKWRKYVFESVKYLFQKVKRDDMRTETEFGDWWATVHSWLSDRLINSLSSGMVSSKPECFIAINSEQVYRNLLKLSRNLRTTFTLQDARVGPLLEGKIWDNSATHIRTSIIVAEPHVSIIFVDLQKWHCLKGVRVSLHRMNG